MRTNISVCFSHDRVGHGHILVLFVFMCYPPIQHLRTLLVLLSCLWYKTNSIDSSSRALVRFQYLVTLAHSTAWRICVRTSIDDAVKSLKCASDIEAKKSLSVFFLVIQNRKERLKQREIVSSARIRSATRYSSSD